METVLDQLDAAQYSSRPVTGGGTIGEHMRHCLDHFICLMRGVDNGVVAYDSRDRDPQLETDPVHARQTLDLIRKNLASLVSAPQSCDLKISQTPAPGYEPIEIPTTLMRELAFLSSHSVHHLALMAEVARQQQIMFPEKLTLAFSTQAYRESKIQKS